MSSSLQNTNEWGGTSQPQRYLPALDPSSAPLDSRTKTQLTSAAQKFSKELAFWSDQNAILGGISWEKFIPSMTGLNLAEAEKKAADFPHQGLYLAFLHIFRHAQADLNELSERHLNFYYQEVLRFSKLPAKPDQAHLTAELKKSSASILLPAKSTFKTETGLIYESIIDVHLHQVKLEHVRTLSVSPKSRIPHTALVSNSLDGLGESLSPEDPTWHPFGYKRELPLATYGFAITDHILQLAEGKRKIIVVLDLKFPNEPPNKIEVQKLFGSDIFEVSLSGEKQWLPANNTTTGEIFTKSGNLYQLHLHYQLEDDAEPVIALSDTKIDFPINSEYPVMRWVLKQQYEENLGDALTQFSSATVEAINITVDVEGMKDIHLENDGGVIDPSKPFRPFGIRAEAGSSFYIGAKEALTKPCTSLSVGLEWQGQPDDFSNYYQSDYYETVENDTFKISLQTLKSGVFSSESTDTSYNVFDFTKTSETVTDSFSITGRGDVEVERTKVTFKIQQPRVFTINISELGLLNDFESYHNNSLLNSKTKTGFARLTLEHGFLFSKYQNALLEFAKKTADDPNGPHIPPNQPYTPEAKNFYINYQASKIFNFSSNNKNSNFIHLHPFGASKKDRTTLVPKLINEGELYLGLTGLEGNMSLSLLVQVENGTASPDSTRQNIKWSVLGENKWHNISTNDITMDTTNGFLQSGLVQLNIPYEASTENSILESGYTWLRASLASAVESTCRLHSIIPNAIPVELTTPEKATHLNAGLPPKSILAPVTPVRGLKKVVQPYLSIGGELEETTPSYYTRVSERLRHKKRSVNAWDYEHMILQEFPQIFKVRTLNHTRYNQVDGRFAKALGHVSLITLPVSSASEAANSLTPQVDTGTLASIEDFIKSHCPPHAEVRVLNPSFETISLSFHVAFREGYPEAYYKPLLRDSLLAHLAPWANNDTLQVDFGGTIYRSSLIAFVDRQPYVDYVTDFLLTHHKSNGSSENVTVASPSHPGTILTPDPKPVITLIQKA